MIQKDFLINNPLTAGSVIAEIKRLIDVTPHKDALLVIYESRIMKAKIRGIVELLTCCGMGNLKIAGAALNTIADILPDGIGIRLNLILTEKTEIEVIGLPCVPGDEKKAVAYMRERLSAHPDAKAVELFACNLGLDTTYFLEHSFKGREEIAVFGTMTPKFLQGTLKAAALKDFFLSLQEIR